MLHDSHAPLGRPHVYPNPDGQQVDHEYHIEIECSTKDSKDGQISTEPFDIMVLGPNTLQKGAAIESEYIGNEGAGHIQKAHISGSDSPLGYLHDGDNEEPSSPYPTPLQSPHHRRAQDELLPETQPKSPRASEDTENQSPQLRVSPSPTWDSATIRKLTPAKSPPADANQDTSQPLSPTRIIPSSVGYGERVGSVSADVSVFLRDEDIPDTLNENQESPTQIIFRGEGAFAHQDHVLPDTLLNTQLNTQPNFQKNSSSSIVDSGSPTQGISGHFLASKNSFCPDPLLPDTQLNIHNDNGSIIQEPSGPFPKPLIPNYFPSSKLLSVGSPSLDTQTKSSREAGSQREEFGDSTMRDKDLPAPLEDLASKPLYSHQNDSLLLIDEDIPDPQTHSSIRVDTQSPDPRTLTSRKETPIDTEVVSSPGHEKEGLETQILILEDNDLPDAQLESLEASNRETLGRNSLISYEDSQLTQDGNDTGCQGPIASLPSLKEMRSKAIEAKLIRSHVTDISDASLKPNPVSNEEKAPLNKVTCRERKRIATSFNRPVGLTKAMKHWINKTHNLLDPFREDDDCWFHPGPPPARLISGILRSCGKLQKRFTWQDHRGRHSLVLNYGIVSKIINFKLTKQQKDGFINQGWHLSHLCGNWTCLNPRHTTVEPGKVNISRNNCFSHRSGCLHDPPCLKEWKVPLAPDGKPLNTIIIQRGETTQRAIDNFEDWSMQSFDDGEVSVLIDDQDETEFALQDDDEVLEQEIEIAD